MKNLIILLVIIGLSSIPFVAAQEGLPPLKQINSGVALVDVACDDNQVQAFKYDAMNVACVSLETKSQLVSRGWAIQIDADREPSKAICDIYGGSWLVEFNECEFISEEQCSMIGGNFQECESACRHDPDAEICTQQCVLVCSIGDDLAEFSLIFTKKGGIAGISQYVSIDTEDNLIEISGLDAKTLGPVSSQDMQSLWEIINQNEFFQLKSFRYPPASGSADFFTYTLDIGTSSKRNVITWTDTSEDYPEQLEIILNEINRKIESYSANT